MDDITQKIADASEPWTVESVKKLVGVQALRIDYTRIAKRIADAHNSSLQPAHVSKPTCDEKYAKLIESRAAHASEPWTVDRLRQYVADQSEVNLQELADAINKRDIRRLLLRVRKFIEPRTECAQDSDVAKRLVKAIDKQIRPAHASEPQFNLETLEGRKAAWAWLQQKFGNPLVVTKDDVPFEDQAEGIRQFKAAAHASEPMSIEDIYQRLKSDIERVRRVSGGAKRLLDLIEPKSAHASEP